MRSRRNLASTVAVEDLGVMWIVIGSNPVATQRQIFVNIYSPLLGGC